MVFVLCLGLLAGVRRGDELGQHFGVLSHRKASPASTASREFNLHNLDSAVAELMSPEHFHARLGNAGNLISPCSSCSA
jgi:hypothetical protein